MEKRGLVGLSARTGDGTEIGRISEIIVHEESGEVTHVIVEDSAGRLEVPISSLTLDPEADFATVRTDASDAEPGDHLGDEMEPQGYAPSASGTEDYPHEGQFATAPQDPSEAQPDEELDREAAQAGGWEDEGSTASDSGYPRNDAYIDPDTGEESVDPAMREGNGLTDEVARVLDGTELEARSVSEGVVELTGNTSQDELETAVSELMELPEVAEVDSTDVGTG